MQGLEVKNLDNVLDKEVRSSYNKIQAKFNELKERTETSNQIFQKKIRKELGISKNKQKAEFEDLKKQTEQLKKM